MSVSCSRMGTKSFRLILRWALIDQPINQSINQVSLSLNQSIIASIYIETARHFTQRRLLVIRGFPTKRISIWGKFVIIWDNWDQKFAEPNCYWQRHAVASFSAPLRMCEWAKYCGIVSVCMLARISLKPHVQTSSNLFLNMILLALYSSSSVGVAIRYVLPVCEWHHVFT